MTDEFLMKCGITIVKYFEKYIGVIETSVVNL